MGAQGASGKAEERQIVKLSGVETVEGQDRVGLVVVASLQGGPRRFGIDMGRCRTTRCAVHFNDERRRLA